MAADKDKKDEKAEAEVVLTEAERLQLLEGNSKLNRILLIVMLVIVGFALPITLTISLLSSGGGEESAASVKQAAALQEQVKTLKGQLSDLQTVLTTQSEQMKALQTTVTTQASMPQYDALADNPGTTNSAAAPAPNQANPKVILEVTRILLGQEADTQQMLVIQQNSLRDLANMVPGSRSWLEDYKESTNKLIASSKARSIELQRWAKLATKPATP